MHKKTYFTVGPAQLYPDFEQYMHEGLETQLGSINHRSSVFSAVYAETEKQLLILFQLPEEFAIFFMPSATEIWERMIENLVHKHSVHFVNGSFSKRFYDYACELGKEPICYEKEHGDTFFALEDILENKAIELICTTQNETSSGVQMPLDYLYALKNKFPNALLCTDIVSSVPFVSLDWSIIDSAFFSVQKGMGLPPGLGVWFVNKKCMHQFEQIKHKNKISLHNRLDNLFSNYEKHQTICTPNTLAIYTLGKVAEAMNKKGIDTIREETLTKAKLIYTFLNKAKHFKALVTDDKYQSKTTIVAKVNNSETIINLLAPTPFIVSSGYANYKKTEIRIANFPSLSIRQVQELISELEKIDKKLE